MNWLRDLNYSNFAGNTVDFSFEEKETDILKLNIFSQKSLKSFGLGDFFVL